MQEAPARRLGSPLNPHPFAALGRSNVFYQLCIFGMSNCPTNISFRLQDNENQMTPRTAYSSPGSVLVPLLDRDSDRGSVNAIAWFDIWLRSLVRCMGRKPSRRLPWYHAGGVTAILLKACAH